MQQQVAKGTDIKFLAEQFRFDRPHTFEELYRRIQQFFRMIQNIILQPLLSKIRKKKGLARQRSSGVAEAAA